MMSLILTIKVVAFFLGHPVYVYNCAAFCIEYLSTDWIANKIWEENHPLDLCLKKSTNDKYAYSMNNKLKTYAPIKATR